mmetsp:Transcript_10998/g.33726  ORF Transcript_10998/g.33726 Transcript_10998/m.33726 type:complete len:402 (+) Transcript_10998:410-1615(+)|eukprot:CAMPEP_0198734726 /NCGR_PEP_ID=MMETSP1475-20131203/54817_1 /TAXON_ID= ORGANISM="Unidentified sp., Strain CCMP1999" /NCGR_SAMPLE_ID=MMETSP1475 /ASSEMBLY_ACC=CAM_ASM_001111 /LENGTH=401 /DNA_ID=CAMNT_0044498255 /DNA_START=396 /DNA_END=1601 /DNA_ORIENTATION=+
MIKLFRKATGSTRTKSLEDRVEKPRATQPDKRPLPPADNVEPERALSAALSAKFGWLGGKKEAANEATIETITERIYEDDDRNTENVNLGFTSNSEKGPTRASGMRTSSRQSSNVSAEGSKRMDSLLSSADLHGSTGMTREFSETPIFQQPDTKSPELIYQNFLAFADPEVIEDKAGEEYVSVNEPELTIKWSPAGANPATKEVKLSRTPICEFAKAKIVGVVGPDDLLVEVIPSKISPDIMDAFNHVVTTRYQNNEAANASDAAKLLGSLNYGVKANGNLSKTFRVRLVGTMSPRPDQFYYCEAEKFVSKNIKGHRVSVAVYGVDAYGRAIADVVLTKINKSVSRALVKIGVLWHYPQLDVGDELKAVMRDAKENKRGLWAADKKPRAPWKSKKEGPAEE